MTNITTLQHKRYLKLRLLGTIVVQLDDASHMTTSCKGPIILNSSFHQDQAKQKLRKMNGDLIGYNWWLNLTSLIHLFCPTLSDMNQFVNIDLFQKERMDWLDIWVPNNNLILIVNIGDDKNGAFKKRLQYWWTHTNVHWVTDCKNQRFAPLTAASITLQNRKLHADVFKTILSS